MYPKNLQQQTDDSSSKARNNPGHYVSKQKTAEIIRVENTSSKL